MKVNKENLAHAWYMKNCRGKAYITDDVFDAWRYADAMQAEADKRVVKGVPEQIEWQPDWSKAPTDKPVDHWAKTEMGNFMWIWYSKGAPIYIPAPDFGYIGHWKDSLRKRPEVKQ